MKERFVLYWKDPHADRSDWIDDDVWELMDLVVSKMDDYDQFRDICWGIVHHYEEYMEEFVLWNIAAAVHHIEDPFDLDILVNEVSDLFYSWLNSKRIDLIDEWEEEALDAELEDLAEDDDIDEEIMKELEKGARE